jgi:hypothetical protein
VTPRVIDRNFGSRNFLHIVLANRLIDVRRFVLIQMEQHAHFDAHRQTLFRRHVHRFLELLQLPRQLFDMRERVHELDTGLERGVRHIAECVDHADMPGSDDRDGAHHHQEQDDSRDHETESAELDGGVRRRMTAAIPEHGRDDQHEQDSQRNERHGQLPL